MDDLAICMQDLQAFGDTLKEKYKIKLNGVDPISYHLGCGYTRDEDGTLVADPKEKPKKTRTTLVAGHHPENDLSDFHDQDPIKEYQTIVG